MPMLMKTFTLYANGLSGQEGALKALSMHFVCYTMKVRVFRARKGWTSTKDRELLVGFTKAFREYKKKMPGDVNLYSLQEFKNRKEVMTKVDHYVSHVLKDVQGDEVQVKMQESARKLLEDIEMDKAVALYIFMAVYKFLVQDLMKTYICTQGSGGPKIFQARIDWLKRKLGELRKCDPESDPTDVFVKFFKVMKEMNDDIELVFEVKTEDLESIADLVKVDFELPLPTTTVKPPE